MENQKGGKCKERKKNVEGPCPNPNEIDELLDELLLNRPPPYQEEQERITPSAPLIQVEVPQYSQVRNTNVVSQTKRIFDKKKLLS